MLENLNHIPHYEGYGSIIPTILSIIPTSIFLQVDSANLLKHTNTGIDTIIAAGFVAILSNIIIKIFDRILLCIAGYKIGDWLFSKFLKCKKKS